MAQVGPKKNQPTGTRRACHQYGKILLHCNVLNLKLFGYYIADLQVLLRNRKNYKTTGQIRLKFDTHNYIHTYNCIYTSAIWSNRVHNYFASQFTEIVG